MKTILALLAMTLSALSADTIHDLTMKDIEGKDMPLKNYAGKAVLIVNVASECGYTGQYAGLQALNQKMAPKGLVVLGVPCNDFGGQEPGDEKTIQTFCSSKYNVTFPMTSKVAIKGDAKHPLYTLLTKGGAEVGWNFEKFLVGKDGKLIQRFGSDAEPESADVLTAIEAALK